MLFLNHVNKDNGVSKNQSIQANFRNKTMFMSFPTPTIQPTMSAPSKTPQQRLKQLTTNNIQTSQFSVDTSQPKKMKWGQPTWFLFHTLAEKVREENFKQIKSELIDLIISICGNLPCPICSEHATFYIHGIHVERIQTKMQLKEMLFNFHNSVNKRKDFPIFPLEELQSKYSTANTMAIIYNFINAFQDKHYGPRMIANDMFRNRLIERVKKWFVDNLRHFDM